jgi:hypothetical protein
VICDSVESNSNKRRSETWLMSPAWVTDSIALRIAAKASRSGSTLRAISLSAFA